jgi:integrase
VPHIFTRSQVLKSPPPAAALISVMISQVLQCPAARARRVVWTAPDGRLFWTYRGGIYQSSTLWQVLQKARAAAFPPAVVASPLARKPYDFRHAGVSWRLNAGTPGPQVAEWAGHSAGVSYRIYAHCIDGDDERWYKRMEDFLG